MTTQEPEDESFVFAQKSQQQVLRFYVSFLTQEIRTLPPRVGDSTCCQTFHDERLMRRTIEYLRRIRFRES